MLRELIDFEREDENETEQECPTCGGKGSVDISKDCETYDEWEDCELCGGCGVIYEE